MSVRFPAATLPEALHATAERDSGEMVFHTEESPVRLSSAELAERATRAAHRLAALGVEPGDSVGVLGPNRPEWVVWAFGTWLAGAVLVPVQIPLRVRDPGAFATQIRSLVRAARCRRVIAEPGLASFAPDDVVVPWREEGPESAGEPPLPSAEQEAVIQFTSGSTAAPKGALLSHAAVMAQMDILEPTLTRDGAPRTTLSWTPYFHDLGLFDNVIPASVWGLTSHHLPTERFAKDPGEWLRLLHSTGVTVTVAPSSAFGSAVRAVARRSERIDLSRLEIAWFAAEGVDPKVAERILREAERFRLPPEALGSSYGLAEAALAVSFPRPGEGMHVDRVGLDELIRSGVAAPARRGPTRVVVSGGRPAAGVELRIIGPQGDLPERHVGEVTLRSASLMRGYVGRDHPDPIVDGWLHTGDLGYLADGELYITGRAKDMVIVMGHNYYPEDFEWAAGRVEGVRPGRCVAFAREGTEEVILLVEPSGEVELDDLAREVARAVSNAVGVGPAEVVVLPRGTVEKTTSGKLRRAAMREAHSTGALQALSGAVPR